MRILKFTPKERFGSNMYVLISETEAAVVDPSVEYSKIASLANAENLTFKYIILTHAHFDHILEIDDWVNVTGAKVIVGEPDAAMLSNPYLNCYKPFLNLDLGYYGSYLTVNDGDVLVLGDTELKIIMTPGHTEGSLTLSTDEELFVGDTLFFGGSYGRCDLPGGDEAKIFSSIKRILTQNEEKKVYCGHGPATTVKQLKSNFI